MIDPELVKYIKRLMADGKTKDEIKDMLTAQLFDINSIDDSLAAVNISDKTLDKLEPKKAPEEGKAKKLFLVFGAGFIILFAVVAAGYTAYQTYTAETVQLDGKDYRLDQHKTLNLKADNETLKFKVDMSSELYHEYQEKRKAVYAAIVQGRTNYSRATLWKGLTETPQEAMFLADFVTQLNDRIDGGETLRHGPDAKAFYTIKFVQGMDKDYVRDWFNARDKKLPYETLYSKTGSEHDKAILLSKLLALQGYGSAVIEIPELHHVVTGVKCDVDARKIQGFCMIEPNSEATIEESGNYQAQFLGVPYKRLSDKSFIVYQLNDGISYRAALD